jgi:hypothetical protein
MTVLLSVPQAAWHFSQICCCGATQTLAYPAQHDNAQPAAEAQSLGITRTLEEFVKPSTQEGAFAGLFVACMPVCHLAVNGAVAHAAA